MLRKTAAIFLLGIPLFAGNLFLQKGHYSFTYDPLTLPASEKMGLLGTDYLYDFGNAYVGLGIYSAVNGHRGGFFTGGIEGGYALPLYKGFILDMGMFIGGGGGGAAAQGGGLMLRPHVGLLYDIYGYKFGVGISKVKFPNGHIDSNQLYAQLSIPFEEIHKKNNDSPMIIDDIEDFTQRNNIQAGWSDTYFSVFGETYFIPKDTKNTRGMNSANHMELVGFEYGEYLNKHMMAYIQAAGAGGGGASGYAQLLGGLGYKHGFNDHFGGYVKAALGAGGGGKVDTGGGIVHQESVGLYAKLNRKLMLNTEIGHIDAVNGNFKASSLMVSLNYNLKSLTVGEGNAPLSTYQSFGDYEVNFKLLNQTYMGIGSNSIRKNNTDKTPINLIGFQLNRFLDQKNYFCGEALSAYNGGAGGYAVGLVGFGKRIQIRERVNLFAQMSAGVAGGGNIATGSGFIYQPMAGIEYNPMESFGLEASLGNVRAINGNLNALVLDFGVSYKFRTLD
jgi:hypothetical protein